MTDTVKFGTQKQIHGSDSVVFSISPFGELPPEPSPIPLWKLALIALGIIGGTTTGYVVARRSSKS